MEKVNVIKYRNKFNKDVFFTVDNIKSRVIDGIEYIPVSRKDPRNQKSDRTFSYVRKDFLEKV